MTKQEQIEEMAKVMPEKIKDPLDNSRYIIFGKSLRREIARIYYNAGYRKVPENAVIIPVEERDEEMKEIAEEQVPDANMYNNDLTYFTDYNDAQICCDALNKRWEKVYGK